MSSLFKTLLWKLVVVVYRKLGLIQTMLYKPFFKSVGIGFGIETGNIRISALHNISIGNNLSLSHGCVLMGEGGIEIGNNVLVGPYTQFYSVDHGIKGKTPITHQPPVTGKITIEDGVWIGANAIILKGVTVGEGAVIGAGSVVTQDVPPYTVYAGNPARFIKQR